MDELKAAGIKDENLRQSYLECKRLNSQHGKTYFLATQLLPKSKRPFVHALYGFARYADEIVDDLDSKLSPHEKREELERWSFQLLQDIKAGRSDDHIGRALVDTVHRFDLPISYFEAFLHSMAMDLYKTEYETFDDLMEYVYGSAAVIGLQMVPILGTLPGQREAANQAAEKLGIAFQLANFIRDVNEDLDRGRIYLPSRELAEFGVNRAMLERRILTPEIIAALKFQIDRVQRLKRESDEGIALLSPESRPCIQAASELYCGIVDEVEKINYEVFKYRAKTSTLRRISVALPAWIRAISAR
ncbi:MAG: phytoene/squalene synthase family protein [Candidatus Nanopelagicaceae bacterium]|nr:phytoene/squalene synthase family protein [Candidatus Nanopelagicaceae bacterium]